MPTPDTCNIPGRGYSRHGLGVAIVVLIYRTNAPDVLEGFGFGAALPALSTRVGGGIYTKAADVGPDLVGKVEQNIPRNAATSRTTWATSRAWRSIPGFMHSWFCTTRLCQVALLYEITGLELGLVCA